MTEALHQEIEEGAHLRHAMLSVWIDRRQWHRLDDMRIREHGHQSTISNRVGDDEVGEPRDATASDRKSQSGLAAIDDGPAVDLHDLRLAVLLKGPSMG